jgi:predicted RNA-binding protein (virulence factor B family)
MEKNPEQYIPGTYHMLTADEFNTHGLFWKLSGDMSERPKRILMPGIELQENPPVEIGDKKWLFVYLDHQGRLMVTFKNPLICLHEIAFLKVIDHHPSGIFVDWGLPKDLFIHKNELTSQHYPDIREKIPVFLFHDTQNQKLAGTQQIQHIIDKHPHQFTEGQKVNIMLWRETDLGYVCIIQHRHSGLLYKNEVFTKIQLGDVVEGYILKIREDGKIDLSVHKPGFDKRPDDSNIILHMLQKSEGFLPFHDHSHPDEIKQHFQMSKKAFKKAVGLLYKDRKIQLKNDGIYLIKN